MPRTRSQPQQQRAHAMRQLLLDSTLHLLERGPAASVTTQAIAETAHVSIGTVYRYFSDREEILGVLRDEMVRAVSNDLTAAVGAALDLELDASMHAVVEALTASFERHAPVLRALAERGADVELSAGIERTLFPLARVLPARHRPDLSARELDDLVFVTMGFTASGCLRIALQRPRGADRDAMVGVTARMLAAALRP